MSALAVKLTGNPTAVVTDRTNTLVEHEIRNVVRGLQDPSGVIQTWADGVAICFPVRSIESVSVLTDEQATALRAKSATRR